MNLLGSLGVLDLVHAMHVVLIGNGNADLLHDHVVVLVEEPIAAPVIETHGFKSLFGLFADTLRINLCLKSVWHENLVVLGLVARGEGFEHFELVVELSILVGNFLGIFNFFFFHLVSDLLLLSLGRVLVNQHKNEVFYSF